MQLISILYILEDSCGGLFDDNSTLCLFYENLFGIFKDKELNPLHTLIFWQLCLIFFLINVDTT